MNKAYPIALILSFAYLALYVLLANLGILFHFETAAESIGSVSGWCERVSKSIFREPANALSNLAFMVSGIMILRILSKDKQGSRNTFIGLNKLSVLYAGATIFLGPGSMLMHGTHTEWGGWADNLSMIMYIVFPWLYNIKEMRRWDSNRFLQVYFLIVIVYAIARWFFGGRLGIGLDLFGLSIGLWIISESLYRFWSPRFRWASGLVGFIVAAVFGITPVEIFTDLREYWWVILFWVPAIFSNQPPRIKRNYFPWFFLGMGSFLLAFAIWLQGQPNDPSWFTDIMCYPDSLLQPHAFWHLITAFSTWSFFLFFRTEKLQENN